MCTNNWYVNCFTLTTSLINWLSAIRKLSIMSCGQKGVMGVFSYKYEPVWRHIFVNGSSTYTNIQYRSRTSFTIEMDFTRRHGENLYQWNTWSSKHIQVWEYPKESANIVDQLYCWLGMWWQMRHITADLECDDKCIIL